MTHTDLEQEILELVKNADFVQECDMWDYVTTEIRDAVRDAEDNVFDRLRESEAETKAEESDDLDLKGLAEKVIKLEEKIEGVLGAIIEASRPLLKKIPYLEQQEAAAERDAEDVEWIKVPYLEQPIHYARPKDAAAASPSNEIKETI